MLMKVVLLILGLLVVFALGAWGSRVQYRRLARARGPLNFDQFLAALPENVDWEIAKKVHGHFESWTGVSDFPLEPTDELREDFGIHGADFEELFDTLTVECGVHLPAGSAADVKTVEDVIVLLSKHRSEERASE